MSRFNFARLIPGARTPAAAPKATTEDDQADPAATDGEDEEAAPAAEGEEDPKPEAEIPAEDEEETPAAKAAFRRGAAAANARWTAIMAQAEPHTAALACQLAAEGLSPKAAARALALAPKPAAAAPGRLAAAMKGRDPDPVRAGGVAAHAGALAESMKRLVGKES
jgi:hypothetical protein